MSRRLANPWTSSRVRPTMRQYASLAYTTRVRSTTRMPSPRSLCAAKTMRWRSCSSRGEDGGATMHPALSGRALKRSLESLAVENESRRPTGGCERTEAVGRLGGLREPPGTNPLSPSRTKMGCLSAVGRRGRLQGDAARLLAVAGVADAVPQGHGVDDVHVALRVHGGLEEVAQAAVARGGGVGLARRAVLADVPLEDGLGRDLRGRHLRRVVHGIEDGGLVDEPVPRPVGRSARGVGAVPEHRDAARVARHDPGPHVGAGEAAGLGEVDGVAPGLAQVAGARDVDAV